jgi:hypothetical protein
MGRQGLDLLQAGPTKKLVTCESFNSRHDTRNLSSGIASVGTLDF